MRKEIDILVRAATRSCCVVEKATNLLWTQEELLAARDSCQYQDAGVLLPPDNGAEVSGPYPGCMQLGSALSSRPYRPIGQTEHFIIFTSADGADAASVERTVG